ncbi:MAG: hypothetical protein AMS15_08270 [Planctomycetes bacterium DG_23]|nr:MAG: hypothetical protein AMS15_08270 [Planctomycetes bacterium DG_23]
MKNAILYFLEHINNEHLGKTKMMKLLYYLDFDHYEQYGKSVTGDVYLRLPYGPVPKHGTEMLEQMADDDAILPVRGKSGPYNQQRYISEEATDLSVFDGSEVAQLEKVAITWEHSTAAEMEQASHSEIPWLVAEAAHKSQLDYGMAQFRTPVGEEPEDKVFSTSPKFNNFVKKLAGKNEG